MGTRIRLGQKATLDPSTGYLKVEPRRNDFDYDGMQIVASLGYAL